MIPAQEKSSAMLAWTPMMNLLLKLKTTRHSLWFITQPGKSNMKQLVKLPNVHRKIVIDLDGVQALKKAQIKVGKLQDQVKKLLLKNSELRANLKGSKNATSSHSVPSDNDKLIAQQAKKFGVMNEVFVPLAALAVK